MEREADEGEGPLSSEALKRGEWRGGGTELKPEDAPGHTLPESERGAADEDRPEGLNPIAGAMPPPD